MVTNTIELGVIIHLLIMSQISLPLFYVLANWNDWRAWPRSVQEIKSVFHFIRMTVAKRSVFHCFVNTQAELMI